MKRGVGKDSFRLQAQQQVFAVLYFNSQALFLEARNQSIDLTAVQCQEVAQESRREIEQVVLDKAPDDRN